MLTYLGGEMNDFIFLEISGGREEPKQTFIILVCAV
jgi:hypothetical protein